MMADLYVDLQFNDDDLVLDPAGEPVLITDRDCITQDIKHMIRDSGLMLQIVGQRDKNTVDDHLISLTLLIEDDERLIPGTVDIEQTDKGVFFITADTFDFGSVNLTVGG